MCLVIYKWIYVLIESLINSLEILFINIPGILIISKIN